ncbi:hypothetical protein [Stenotrophomonas phage CM2]
MNLRKLWTQSRCLWRSSVSSVCLVVVGVVRSAVKRRACREAGGERWHSHTTYALINGTMYPMHHYECSAEVK